jgi:hypothetical protein
MADGPEASDAAGVVDVEATGNGKEVKESWVPIRSAEPFA